MESNKCIDIVYKAQEELWVDEINKKRLNGSVEKWVSEFHPHQLTCKLDGGFLNGGYNVGQKVIFDDGTAWLLRFPRVSSIHPKYADEKVAMEVEIMNLLREQTTIPVPKIHAWAVATDNPLELGPFIIMDFIDGQSLNNLLVNYLESGQPESRILKEDISDNDIKHVYRQMANFLLQILSLNFDKIGSLAGTKTGFNAPIRPLTWKVHDILQTGGVDTFNPGFSTATDYFNYILGQDWDQLNYQANPVAGKRTAAESYKAFKILKSVIRENSEYINKDYDHGPFKLICDDLGLANMIVKSKEDLTIIGVVDLEWSYTGPAQLFGSAPWWLLQDRPTNCDWDYNYKNGEPPELATRYFKYLNIFKEILEEEEKKITGDDKKTPLTDLVKWSEQSGAMWLHMLLSSGFNTVIIFLSKSCKKIWVSSGHDAGTK